MSKTSSASKIKMKSFEDLFGTNEVVGAKNISGEIRDIPLNSLHTFRNHTTPLTLEVQPCPTV